MKFHCVPKSLYRSCDTLQKKSLTPSPPIPHKKQSGRSQQNRHSTSGSENPTPDPDTDVDVGTGPTKYKVVKMKPERWHKIDYPGREGPLAYYSISICNICNKHNTKSKLSRFMQVFKRNKETDDFVDPEAYSDKFLETLKKKFVLPPDESQSSET